MQLQTLPFSPIDDFIDSFTTELGDLISFGMGGNTTQKETKFHSPSPPLSLRKFVERITTYAPCSVECFVVALVYINRMTTQKQGFVNIMTIQRLFLASLLLASKYFDDLFYNNKFYAKVGGIPCSELNDLEREFLTRCGFSLSISPEEFLLFSHVLFDSSSSVCHMKGGRDSLAFFSISPVSPRPTFEGRVS